MQAVKVTGIINKDGQLQLDQPLNLAQNSRVEVIVLVQDSVSTENVSSPSDMDTPDEEVLFAGDLVQDIGYEVFKLRIKNSDIQKGKSGGYRLIYYLKTVDKVILLTIYSKSEQSDIAAEAIRQIILEGNQYGI